MRILTGFSAVVAVTTSAILTAGGTVGRDAYDPLVRQPGFHLSYVDLTVHDTTRKRDLPIRVYLPVPRGAQPVVLFSHGLGASKMGSAFLGEHWAGRGYVAIFIQHPGSDDSVWIDEPVEKRAAALRDAASIQNFRLRVQDVSAVLNQLGTWNASGTSLLAGRLDLTKVGMSGHSFGALTTQAVGGETVPLSEGNFTDPRIKAALVLSPSTPRRRSAEKAFDSVAIPWMLMTGTRDQTRIGNASMRSRLAVYPALHHAAKYELVLHEAEHSIFMDSGLPGDRASRNPNHHRAILALSTAFWDAYLLRDAAALAWLNGPGPRSILEPEDQWQCQAAVNR